MSSPHLFSAWQLGDLALANRIVIAPMCQYSAQDGRAGDWHRMHVPQLATSGAGLLILEATAVSPEGRISAHDLGLYDEACEAALVPVLAAARALSPMPIAMQLGHAGRKASVQVPWAGGRRVPAGEPGAWTPLAPSALAQVAGDAPPQALDEAGIQKVIADFVAAAERAARLGIDGLELHLAHGYLLHQFLSPLSNQRSDAWGGDLAGRMRLPLAVFDAVRAVFPAGKPVWVRVSATDWVDGGWSLDDTVLLAQALATRGCAAVHVSTGGLSTAQQIHPQPGYQLPHARRVREASGLPVMGVGLITEPQQAEDALQRGDADAIALGRALLWNPHWPWAAALALGAQVQVPPAYHRAAPPGRSGVFAGV